MPESDGVNLAFRLFKVAVFLAVGSLIGLLLGLAYASHLYGTPPVVTQLQNWFAGDSMYEGPLPVDIQGNLLRSPVALIPKLGACVGFGIAASVLFGSIMMKMFMGAVGSAAKTTSPSSASEARLESQDPDGGAESNDSDVK